MNLSRLFAVLIIFASQYGMGMELATEKEFTLKSRIEEEPIKGFKIPVNCIQQSKVLPKISSYGESFAYLPLSAEEMPTFVEILKKNCEKKDVPVLVKNLNLKKLINFANAVDYLDMSSLSKVFINQLANTTSSMVTMSSGDYEALKGLNEIFISEMVQQLIKENKLDAYFLQPYCEQLIKSLKVRKVWGDNYKLAISRDSKVNILRSADSYKLVVKMQENVNQDEKIFEMSFDEDTSRFGLLESRLSPNGEFLYMLWDSGKGDLINGGREYYPYVCNLIEENKKAIRCVKEIDFLIRPTMWWVDEVLLILCFQYRDAIVFSYTNVYVHDSWNCNRPWVVDILPQGEKALLRQWGSWQSSKSWFITLVDDNVKNALQFLSPHNKSKIQQLCGVILLNQIKKKHESNVASDIVILDQADSEIYNDNLSMPPSVRTIVAKTCIVQTASVSTLGFVASSLKNLSYDIGNKLYQYMYDYRKSLMGIGGLLGAAALYKYLQSKK